MENEKKFIEDYAESLLYHGICKNQNLAKKEAKRWYKKHLNGLEEPMPCPHSLHSKWVIINVYDKID